MKAQINILILLLFFTSAMVHTSDSEDKSIVACIIKGNDTIANTIATFGARFSSMRFLYVLQSPCSCFPPELYVFKSLKHILFIDCPMNGSGLPEELFCMRTLKVLVFKNCSLGGEISPRIGKLHQLKKLNLEQNELTGSIPTGIIKLMGLKVLRLGNNKLSGAIPQLSTLTDLSFLGLAHNRLEGSLPAFPENLKFIYLNNNLLSGPLTKLWDATKLERINVSHNELTGPLSRIEHLHRLEELCLADNPLNIPFPKEILKLYNLKAIELQNTILKGSVPQELCALSELIVVNLASNYLEGALPKDLGTLSSLRCFFITNNPLTGKVPNFPKSIEMLHMHVKDVIGTLDIRDYPNLTRLGFFEVVDREERLYKADYAEISSDILISFLETQKEIDLIVVRLTAGDEIIAQLRCDYNNEGRRQIVYYKETLISPHHDELEKIISIAGRHLGNKRNIIDLASSPQFIE